MLFLDRTRTSSATTRPGQRTTTCSFKTSSATVGWHSAAFGVIGDMWGGGGGGLAPVGMVTDICGKELAHVGMVTALMSNIEANEFSNVIDR